MLSAICYLEKGVRLVLYGQNTCYIFTMSLSGTQGMNQINELLTDQLHRP